MDGRIRTRRQHTAHRQLGREDCLVFMHIPKTGGTTLYPTLQWNYPPQRTLHMDLPANGLHQMEDVPIETRSRLRLLHGHLAYGIHEYIPRRCLYVTVLRAPVARVVSAYKQILRRPDHRFHDRVVKRRIGLEEFIETLWVDARMNRQVRDLCNKYEVPLGSGDLEQAKRNLEGFLLVGLTERFEETFAMLRRALGLRIPFYVIRNVGFPIKVSKRAVSLIREREQLDLQLYDFASELFSRELEAQGNSFGLEVAAYKALRPLSRALGSGRAEDFLRQLSHARAAWNHARVRPFVEVRPDPSIPWGGAPPQPEAPGPQEDEVATGRSEGSL